MHEEQLRNNWYYWTNNRHAHFIRFRDRANQVASAWCKLLENGQWKWHVYGPCWTLTEANGVAETIEQAKQAAEAVVLAIIKEEYGQESSPFFG